MDLKEIINQVRSYSRDFNGTIFREEDIILFANEGVDRIVQVFPILSNMPYLVEKEDFPGHIPLSYHHLLSIYSVSRLFSQDERHYEATNYMNEFEIKLEEFKEKVDNGEVQLRDPETGEVLEGSLGTDYVVDNYFLPNRRKRGNFDTFDDLGDY